MALWGTWLEGRSGIWAPFLPCPPRPQAVTSHLPVEDRVFPGWGEMGPRGCLGEGVCSPVARAGNPRSPGSP